MATKKKNAKKTAARKGKQAPAPQPAPEKQPPQTNRVWSVLVFCIALVLGALAFIPGQAGWTAVRDFFFGVFGWTLYAVPAALLYIAVLIACKRPWRAKMVLFVLVLLLLCGAALVFTDYQPQQAKLGQLIQGLYQWGIQRRGGGVLALPLGLSLLTWAGRPAANILLVILLVVFGMLFGDVTPADIVAFIHRHAKKAREGAAQALSQRDERRSQRQAAREVAEAAAAASDAADPPQGARSRPRVDPHLPPETFDRPRDRWNIDVELRPDVDVRPPLTPPAAPAAPLEDTAGGAFDAAAQRRAMADLLAHDGLSAAGREALRPTRREPPPQEKAAGEDPFVRDMEPVSMGVPPLAQPHRQPFDQDAADTAEAEAGAHHLYDQDAHAPAHAAAAPAAQSAPAVPEAPAREAPDEDDLPPFDLVEEPAPQPQPAADAPDAAGKDGIDTLIHQALSGHAPFEEGAGLAAEPAPAAPLPPPYRLPAPQLLDRQPEPAQDDADAEMRHNAQVLVSTLESFGVKTRILDICRGPSVTRYELQPLAGVKISRITSLADDIALNLASAGVRIEAPIPGKPAVGIEVPNKVKATVALRSLIQSEEFAAATSPLTMCLGRDIAGALKLADLARMPHLLIAGSTGSGKSVCINSIIMSFLYKASPDELRLILIDPKVVELAEYNGIPHLLMPVVTKPREAAGALGCAVAEMERRYQLFADNNVREIKSFNRLAAQRDDLAPIPYIAIIIDELADLMMVAGKQVEDYICRIAQKARAAGMHLIVATQRPSVDVITGLIKANIPSRIAFAVSSQVDSRTILDGAGAEKLLGMGDMLFLPVGANKPTRIQGTFVKDSEIERVIGEIKSYADSRYDEEMMARTSQLAAAAENGGKEPEADQDDDDARDPMLMNAIEVVLDAKQASTSLLQRKLKLGYARAARIMDEMEALGVIGGYEGSKPRQVLISRDQFLEMSLNSRD